MSFSWKLAFNSFPSKSSLHRQHYVSLDWHGSLQLDWCTDAYNHEVVTVVLDLCQHLDPILSCIMSDLIGVAKHTMVFTPDLVGLHLCRIMRITASCFFSFCLNAKLLKTRLCLSQTVNNMMMNIYKDYLWSVFLSWQKTGSCLFLCKTEEEEESMFTVWTADKVLGERLKTNIYII